MPDSQTEAQQATMTEDSIAAQLHKILSTTERTEANVNVLTSSVAVVNSRLSAVEGRVSLVEEARKANSDRVKAVDARTSSADLEHDAKIAATAVAHADLVAKVDGIASDQALQLAILKRIDAAMVVVEKIGKSPLFRVLIAIATVSALGWAASKGITVKLP